MLFHPQERLTRNLYIQILGTLVTQQPIHYKTQTYVVNSFLQLTQNNFGLRLMLTLFYISGKTRTEEDCTA